MTTTPSEPVENDQGQDPVQQDQGSETTTPPGETNPPQEPPD